jgi:radical SAM protein with 4Fe4S-binding SPASM domain
MTGKLSDWVNIASKLNLSRSFNLLQLKISYILAKYFKKPVVWGKPFSVSIEPTTACNLACPECPSGLKQFTRPTGKLSLDLNTHILDELGKQLFYINYYFQGEPFLNPQFLELVKEAKKRKIYTATSTNAHFINQKKAMEIVASGLDRLIISIDGLSQETYSSYRVNGQLEKVIRAAKHMFEAKKSLKSKTPHLIFQFLVVKPNEHEVAGIFKLGKEIGLDEVRLKTAQVYDYKNGNPLIPENSQYSRYKKMKNGQYRLKAETGNHCWRMWSSTVITWDGKIVPCCFDKDAHHILGDVSSNKFQKIWKSKAYKTMRKNILHDRNKIDICKNCSEGAKVWV